MDSKTSSHSQDGRYAIGVHEPDDGWERKLCEKFPNDIYTGQAILFPPRLVSFVLSEERKTGSRVDPEGSSAYLTRLVSMRDINQGGMELT